jgi:hypothetical protein
MENIKKILPAILFLSIPFVFLSILPIIFNLQEASLLNLIIGESIGVLITILIFKYERRKEQ